MESQLFLACFALFFSVLHVLFRLWFYGQVGWSSFKQAQGWFVEHLDLRNNVINMWRLFKDHSQSHLNITMETNPSNVSFNYVKSTLALSQNVWPGSQVYRPVNVRSVSWCLSSFDTSAYTRPPDRGSRNIQNNLIYVSISRFLSTRKRKKCRLGVHTLVSFSKFNFKHCKHCFGIHFCFGKQFEIIFL